MEKYPIGMWRYCLGLTEDYVNAVTTQKDNVSLADRVHIRCL